MKFYDTILLTLYDLGEQISSVWQNFDFKIRRDHGKDILWAHVSKIDGENKSGDRVNSVCWHKALLLLTVSASLNYCLLPLLTLITILWIELENFMFCNSPKKYSLLLL